MKPMRTEHEHRSSKAPKNEKARKTKKTKPRTHVTGRSAYFIKQPTA